MPLLQEMEQQGLVMFKYRGILPVIIILAGLGVYIHTKVTGNEVTFIDETYFEFVCLAVALFGGIIRAYTVGYTPFNTSGRNIDSQVADTVNTIGMYSIVRHPLYVGNFFCSLGIAMLTQNLWFVLFFIAVYWLYYERIMFAEEQFLTKKFGDRYTSWASVTPAFICNLTLWKKNQVTFSFRKVIRGEKNIFFYIFLIIFIFSVAGEFVVNGKVEFIRPYWAIACLVWVLIYIVLKLLKEYTHILTDDFMKKKAVPNTKA
jgi:protein-S-isoprenylcysteine O-methyltransferase Ste14